MRELTAEELAHISLLGDTSPWPVLEFGSDGALLYANPAAVAAASASGVDDFRVFLPDDHGVSAMAAHTSCEIFVGGHTYDARITVSPDRERVLVYALDITERKKAEDALRLTQLSVDRAADLIHWITSDGRLLYVSESNCRRHGYSCAEMLAMTVFDIDPQMTPEAWRQHWADIKQQGSAVLETVHRTKQGDAVSARSHRQLRGAQRQWVQLRLRARYHGAQAGRGGPSRGQGTDRSRQPRSGAGGGACQRVHGAQQRPLRGSAAPQPGAGGSAHDSRGAHLGRRRRHHALRSW